MTEGVNVGTDPPHDREPENRGLNGVGRVLIVVGLTAVVMLLADASVHLFLLAAFGMPELMYGVLLLPVGIAIAIMGISRSVLGRAGVLGAIVVTLLFVGLWAWAVTSGVTGPLLLWPDGGLHFALAGLSAASIGLFIGRWPVRIVGAVAAFGAIALIAVLPNSAQRATIRDEQAAERTAAARLYDVLDDGPAPAVTNLRGWRTVRVHAGESGAYTWIANDGAAVATAAVYPVSEATNVNRRACFLLTEPGDPALPSDDAAPDWCRTTSDGWARTDARGLAYLEDGRLIALKAATEDDLAQLRTGHPASAEDIAALSGTLRRMTTADIDQYIAYLDG